MSGLHPCNGLFPLQEKSFEEITINELCDRAQTPDNYLHTLVDVGLLFTERNRKLLLGTLNQCGRWWIAHANKINREEMQERLYKIVDAYIATMK